MSSSAFKTAKRAALLTGKTIGFFEAVARSGWRRQRLLILCYHGVSQRDEHLWNPQLYVSPDTFRERLRVLNDGGYAVLPLGEALERLRNARLPRRSVVLTFDDGHSDFMSVAHPILSDFGFPATVYLTTYHVDDNVPIFSLVTSYLLWQGRRRTVDLAEWAPDIGQTPLSDAARRSAAHRALLEHVQQRDLDSPAKQALVETLAHRLDIDLSEVMHHRILHLLNPEEVTQLARAGVDFQLHSHCHRAPLDEGQYRRQIRLNRDRIRSLTGVNPVHFCYPSGVLHRSFPGWLESEGVHSAVTCVPGLAARDTPSFLLPRLLDHEGLSPIEFRAWLDGPGAWLPASTQTAVASRATNVNDALG